MQTKELLNTILTDLGDLKAIDIQPLDVRRITPLTDFMVVASGNSSRHVNAIAQNLVRKMKERQIRPRGVEGDKEQEWVLVDLGAVVVHIMQPRTREFYQLEKLWAIQEQTAVAHA